MSMQKIPLVVTFAVGLMPNLGWGQHEAHQAGGTQAPNAELTQCLRVQPMIENIITAAMARAEAARLSNSPTELRAALDHLESALRDVRAQSAPCAAAAATSDPHAGHAMPATQNPSGLPPNQVPTVPADPHAGHGAAPSSDKQMDPVTGLMVDPATAPKTTYQGQTYYFSSEQSRREFLQNPAKFANKPKE